ncbi:hypothetical protein GCM10009850_053690 [Nonomuraea monospora]|uniref:Uncharacterized protein n=1 Tax=Nonomuraea monospora TaxID=568818 RepID=A0ABN3CKL6_9ACTN
MAGAGRGAGDGRFGFAPELFAELEGAPLVTSAAPTSTGDGLLMARRVGAGLQGLGRYLPPHDDGDPRVDWLHRPQLVVQERPPREIYVDRSGRRWIAEPPSRTIPSRSSRSPEWTWTSVRGCGESMGGLCLGRMPWGR